MNEMYLGIMGVMFVYSLFQVLTGAFDYEASELRAVSTILTWCVFGVMLILSGVGEIGSDLVVTKPATNTKLGNELIIQAEGWPTQVINDISLIDKEVQIKKIRKQNAWGGGLTTQYAVEPVIKTEVE